MALVRSGQPVRKNSLTRELTSPPKLPNIYTSECTYPHIYLQTQLHTQVHMHTYAHIHTQTHTHTDARIHVYVTKGTVALGLPRGDYSFCTFFQNKQHAHA